MRPTEGAIAPSAPAWLRVCLTCFFVGFRTYFVTSVTVSVVSAGVLALAGLRPAGARKPQGGVHPRPPPLATSLSRGLPESKTILSETTTSGQISRIIAIFILIPKQRTHCINHECNESTNVLILVLIVLKILNKVIYTILLQNNMKLCLIIY